MFNEQHSSRSHTPDDYPLEYTDIAIVGSGIAGLATAILAKEKNPDSDITVLEKRIPQSNSQIAGQRYRSRANHSVTGDPNQVAELMAQRNLGVLTPQMSQFATMSTTEIEHWKEEYDMPMRDELEWFGPQFGDPSRSVGFGRQVLGHLRNIAINKNIHFLEGEASGLSRDGDQIQSLELFDSVNQRIRKLGATIFIIANGSAGGVLFHSTNKQISNSAHELAFRANLPLVGSTINMLHPFARCDNQGNPRVGCYETDNLADADIYLGLSGDDKDEMTTDLLRRHEAHQNMPSIAKHFHSNGSIVRIAHPSQPEALARVSHHYSHLGIKTTDGVSVEGVRNGFAVGDASSIGYWTSYKERIPGAALAKCLVDAALTAAGIDLKSQKPNPTIEHPLNPEKDRSYSGSTISKEVKDINTDYMVSWKLADTAEEQLLISERWQQSLAREQGESTLLDLSNKIAIAHRLAAEGIEEPIIINNL